MVIQKKTDTRLRASARQQFYGGACGTVAVDLYDSTDWACHGGLVLRLLMDDGGCAHLPWARNIPGGVEIHIGGDDEADVFAAALIQVLAQRGVRAGIVGGCVEVAPTVSADEVEEAR